jgi:hypothetical protein
MESPGIRVLFIEQGKQRYWTAGDYFRTDGMMTFTITDMGDPVFNLALLLHELYEACLVEQRGVGIAAVDEWDWGHPELEDPGAHPNCPYRREHMEAEVIERMCIALAGKTWLEYEEKMDAAMGERKESQ